MISTMIPERLPWVDYPKAETVKEEEEGTLTASESMRWAKTVYGERGSVRIDRGVKKVGILDDNDRLRVKGFGSTWDAAVEMAGKGIPEAL